MLHVNNLSKYYGEKNILDNLTFQLESNQIVGLLGPNGCGKTTLLKIIMGYIMDYEGSVFIDDLAPSPKTKAQITFLPETTAIDEWWKIKRVLSYFSDMFADFDLNKAQEMLHFFKLDYHMRLRSMSKGMKEKLHIALVMSRRAKFYILDEPLGGIDPASRSTILENIIKNYNEKSLLLLSTHLISDIEPILDRVIMLKDKKLFIDAQADEIRAKENMSIDAYFRKVYREV